MDAENPWQVETIEVFYFLKCPECMFFTKEEKGFYHHAVENHSLSFILFGKPTKSFQLHCDQEILLSETKHLKEIEKETEIVKTDMKALKKFQRCFK